MGRKSNFLNRPGTPRWMNNKIATKQGFKQDNDDFVNYYYYNAPLTKNPASEILQPSGVTKLVKNNPNIATNILRKTPERFDWDIISSLRPITPAFLTEFQDWVNWQIISWRPLSAVIMTNFADRLHWRLVLQRNRLNEVLLDELSTYLDWESVCITQKLSIDFIAKHIDDILPYKYHLLRSNKFMWYLSEQDRDALNVFLRIEEILDA